MIISLWNLWWSYYLGVKFEDDADIGPLYLCVGLDVKLLETGEDEDKEGVLRWVRVELLTFEFLVGEVI